MGLPEGVRLAHNLVAYLTDEIRAFVLDQGIHQFSYEILLLTLTAHHCTKLTLRRHGFTGTTLDTRVSNQHEQTKQMTTTTDEN